MNTDDRTGTPPQSSEGMRRATGRDRGEWFAVLDTWGAAGRPYREIAGWLTSQHGLSPWWAQKLIVEYEQARGLRDPGVRSDGTLSVGVSRTIAAPIDDVFQAFVDAGVRQRWLPGIDLRERTVQAGRSARFDWGDGTRINVSLQAKGDVKAVVAVEHERLPDTRAAQEAKASWRDRLSALKTMLEG